MRLRLQRTTLPKLSAHPAHCRYTKTEKLENLASAVASFIAANNPLTHIALLLLGLSFRLAIDWYGHANL